MPYDPVPVAALLPVDAAALAMAKKFRAIDAEGRIWCIKCPQDDPRPGALPHLCCPVHIAEARRRR